MANEPQAQPIYFGAGAGAATRSLAEVQIADMTTRIDAFSADLDREQATVSRLTEVFQRMWREPDSAARVSEDIEAAHRRIRITKNLRSQAIAERDILERQVVADRISAVRAEWDKQASARTARARDLVATLQTACALIVEIDESLDRAVKVLDRPLEGGLHRDQIACFLRRETVQGFVDEIMARTLSRNLWDAERPVLGWRGDLETKLPDYIDAERRSVLAAFDMALERVTRGQTFGAGKDEGPAHAAAESHRLAQERAAQAATANGTA